VLIDQLNSLGTGEPLTVRQLEDNMRDASLSPMIVMLLRMLASAEIQRRGDFFYPFILVRSARARNGLLCPRTQQNCWDAARAGQRHDPALRRPVLSLHCRAPWTSRTRFSSCLAAMAGPDRAQLR